LDVVAAGGEEMHPGQVWGVGFGVGGEGGEGYEDCCFGEEGFWWGVFWIAGGVVVGDVEVRVLLAERGDEVGGFGEGEGDEEVFFCWSAAHCW
jgi:hypothetical protein